MEVNDSPPQSEPASDPDLPASRGEPSLQAQLPPLIGVGASAGGLEALETFFQGCPVDSGVIFVVIQHLLADHKSMMASLLARHTAMPVELAENGQPLRADHVYLIPPGMLMRIERGRFVIWPKAVGGLSLPIDIFFNSMAGSHAARAAAIVLSGTGTDGTRGAAEVNANGGLVLAQQPDTAKFDGMPRSLMASGIVDAVLPPEQLAKAAIDYLQRRVNRAELSVTARQSQQAGAHLDRFTAILETLRDIGDIDFQDYKEPTVLRRIERRMQMSQTDDMASYLDLLQRDREEAATLRREILIGVTSFFRDTEAFQALAAQVIAPIVRDKKRGDVIRVWAAGISSGEEAYSIAMLFLEEFETQQRWFQLKLFATDVDGQKIEMAGQGSYPESAAAELTPARMERFFLRQASRLVVRIDLRQHVVFARHNLLSDPPFTRMDLVICRNTLIYFKPPAQERVLARLQYGVVPGGYLFLGSSESLGPNNNTVLTVDSKHKIFRRTFGHAHGLMGEGSFTLERRPAGAVRAATTTPARVPVDGALAAAEAARVMLLESHAPPSLLVDGSGMVLHLFGDLRPFLAVRSGATSLQLDHMLPKMLASTAFALVSRVLREGSPVQVSLEARLADQTDASPVLLACRPILQGEPIQHALISLHLQPAPGAAPASDAPGFPAVAPMSQAAIDQLGVLERELQATRENLQATIEELETSNEELQATNEELISANEELQSSNEELQSLNEELQTVNSEFQEKLDLLHRANADLESLARAAGIATVFVDADLRLTRFSPDACTLFRLRSSDIGRRLDDFSNDLDYPDLIRDLEHTLTTQIAIEREIPALGGRDVFLARILPYVVPSSAVRGVVATFVNITAYHDARRLQVIIDALPEHIAVLAPDGTIMMVNEGWRRFARANGDPELAHTGPGANYLHAAGAPEDAPAPDTGARAARGLRDVLEGRLPAFSMEYPCHGPGQQRWFIMSVAPVGRYGYGAVVSHFEVSELRATVEQGVPSHG